MRVQSKLTGQGIQPQNYLHYDGPVRWRGREKREKRECGGSQTAVQGMSDLEWVVHVLQRLQEIKGIDSQLAHMKLSTLLIPCWSWEGGT